MRHRKASCCWPSAAITFWGLTDSQSWLSSAEWGTLRGRLPHYPLLFDSQYQPKPIVVGVLDALAGLSRPLRALSFEYLPMAHEAALAVLERVEALGGGRYRYNYSPIETMRWASEPWLDAGELVALLERYRPLGRSGDVYARLV